MTPVEAIQGLRGVLEKETSPDSLVSCVAIFLSLDPELQKVLFAEAQNRLVLAGVVGKKPWEVG